MLHVFNRPGFGWDSGGSTMARDVPLGPNPVDIFVGGRVRLRRKSLGMSQSALADELGLTFQQIQKYERGANRISASTLYKIATALNAPISYFYDSLPPTTGDGETVANDDHRTLADALFCAPGGLAMAQSFILIRRSRVQRELAKLTQELAANDREAGPEDLPAVK